MLQNATPLRKSAPGPPNSSDEHSLVLRLPRKIYLGRSSSNVPRLPSFLKLLRNLHVLLTFDKVHNPLHLPRKTISERPKVRQTRQSFTLLTWKCASRHNGVHFFDIATSKSDPELHCFVHFDLEMCFSPQRRAIFHLSSDHMATLASLLFEPPEPQMIGKTRCFATFLPFRAPGSSFFSLFLFSIFFLLLFFSLTLPISAFHLSTLSEVWLLNFLRSFYSRFWMHVFQCCIAVSLLPNHCSGFTGSCSVAVTKCHHCHQCWSVTAWQHVTTAASCQRCHHTVTVTVHWSLITVMLNLQKVMQNLLLLPLDLAGSPCKTEAAESPTGFVWKRVPLNPLVKQHVPHQGCNFGVPHVHPFSDPPQR